MRKTRYARYEARDGERDARYEGEIRGEGRDVRGVRYGGMMDEAFLLIYFLR